MTIGDNYQAVFKEDKSISQKTFGVDISFQEFIVTIVKGGVGVNCPIILDDGI